MGSFGLSAADALVAPLSVSFGAADADAVRVAVSVGERAGFGGLRGLGATGRTIRLIIDSAAMAWGELMTQKTMIEVEKIENFKEQKIIYD